MHQAVTPALRDLRPTQIETARRMLPVGTPVYHWVHGHGTTTSLPRIERAGVRSWLYVDMVFDQLRGIVVTVNVGSLELGKETP